MVEDSDIMAIRAQIDLTRDTLIEVERLSRGELSNPTLNTLREVRTYVRTFGCYWLPYSHPVGTSN